MDITTKYGILYNCYNIARHKNGQVSECICQQESPLTISGTIYFPYYRENERRKLSPSIKFYSNGSVKSLYLEEQTIIKSSLGNFPAELITFYPDGSLCRVFPLNGKITGYWSEESEIKLIEKMPFSFFGGAFSARPMCFHFYEDGKLKSLTLQPSERILLNTPAGKLKIKCGFSLYEDGSLRSTEPAAAQKISTAIGEITVFDPDSVNVSADNGSLIFTKTGDIASLKTTSSITVTDTHGHSFEITPIKTVHPLNENALLILPLLLKFTDGCITIIRSGLEQYSYPVDQTHFTII
ncbi:hypothetical protein [Pectinatus haikarae]|uniref:Adhesin domain-containing protein n=1 Tax=Pectinatus haikarae TaxID=349096 RepID=A0ABT9Y5T9_9FIRM|nr:hypothetical protein [Pectinatus haikarae]MDQ0202921.1 hypothetical protein [Pectinatus haikarae]